MIEYSQGDIVLKKIFLSLSISLAFFLIISSFFLLDKMVSYLFKGEVKNPYVFLVLGKDKEIEHTVRTDVIVVGVLDWKKGNLSFVSIPRDLMIEGKKINAIYNTYGMEKLFQIIESLLGLKPDSYVIFNYEAFKILGDELGPIEVIPNEVMFYEDLSQNLVIDFKPGVPYKLNGEQLLAYIRYRKDSMGDLARIERQKDVLKKLLSKALSRNPLEISVLYKKISPYIETDIGLPEILTLFSKLKNSVRVSFSTLPYKVDSDGSIFVDERRLGSFKKNLIGSSVQEKYRVNFLVVNTSSLVSRVFEANLRGVWKDRVGFEPDRVVWEDVGISQKFEGDHVFIGEPEKEDYILGILKKAHPSRHFTVHRFDRPEDYTMYYTILEGLVKNRIYPDFPVSALILIDDFRE
ncbi:cell envelope-related transcriptional attenuator [Thermotoga petrophila RKU-10]|uniref:Cell envelope-related transcriptional attenuator n=1 Tax=Thermotoga petrophila (strain ATCC BAA-489 / DSM 13996 / JCM 10882 / RKU-10) TaxID=590168 RepID=D2C6Y3_THEP2|nr:cell envelope-related transcriptional attenuator [Thermotoga petrophila RKU-10]